MGFLKDLLEYGQGHGYRKSDNVHVFGGAAGIVSIVSGIVVYLLILPLNVAEHIRVLGLVWVVFGLVCFYALYVFEYEDRRRGGRILALSGILGFISGCGFFIGSLMMFFSGLLAIKYSVRRIGEKLC